MTEGSNVREHYDKSATDWDETFAAEKLNPRHVQACWRIFRKMLGDDCGNGTAVELGVGTGLFTDRLAPRFQRLVAVDFSQQMLEALRANMARKGIGNIDYICARAEALETVESGSIDAVWCFGLLENIKELEPLFREVRRILKPGGRFVGVASNGACPWYTIRRRLKPDAWYWQDVNLHTAGALRAAAQAGGLTEHALRGWGLIPSQIPDSPLLAPFAAAEWIIEQTPLRRWMGGLAFRFDAPAQA
jgi:ubiquinone/menaquinone biosynthesis C-methylase UbiE